MSTRRRSRPRSWSAAHTTGGTPVTPGVLPPLWPLVETHGDELLTHARRLAGDSAEDVVQDALLRALRAYPKLRHAAHLRAWLYHTTTTPAIDPPRRPPPELPMDEPPAVATFDPPDDFESLIEP